MNRNRRVAGTVTNNVLICFEYLTKICRVRKQQNKSWCQHTWFLWLMLSLSLLANGKQKHSARQQVVFCLSSSFSSVLSFRQLAFGPLLCFWLADCYCWQARCTTYRRCECLQNRRHASQCVLQNCNSHGAGVIVSCWRLLLALVTFRYACS